MSEPITKRNLRSFGLLTGAIWAVIGVLPWVFRGAPLRTWALVLGGLLAGFAVVWPAALHYPYRGWMALGHALGWINSRILLSLVFYLVVTPMGFVMRLFGRDPMNRKLDRDATSYRIPREPRPGEHMRQQF
jgi:saxitoxin biosynthesis operon SxtJ-like protein